MLDILVPITLFAMIFGIVYLRSRERMAMIEKGLNPGLNGSTPAPYINLKWALLLIGSGTGLLLAFLLTNYVLAPSANIGGEHSNGPYNPVFIYFALIAIGGGLGLFVSYKIEKKEMNIKH